MEGSLESTGDQSESSELECKIKMGFWEFEKLDRGNDAAQGCLSNPIPTLNEDVA